MDTLTQGLLGAAVGQACCGRALGRRAVLWGAVAGVLPDLDMLAGLSGPMGEFLHHRGITHALWFGPAVGSLLGWLLWRRGRQRGDAAPLGAWLRLMVLALITHPLLDLFTSYGTQLLAPFSNRRFAVDAIAIVDPAYSLLLAAALGIGRWRGLASPAATRAAALALLLSSAYVGYCLWLNQRAEAAAQADLAARGINAAKPRAYPTLLQPFLRRLVARSGNEVWIGWLSLWNQTPARWERFTPARHPAVEALKQTREGRIFEWFALGQTAASLASGADGEWVVLDDLRYGLPGSPEHGLWGIRARVIAGGPALGAIDRFDRPVPLPAGRLLGQLLRLSFGAPHAAPATLP
jgi:inner membrane protein